MTEMIKFEQDANIIVLLERKKHTSGVVRGWIDIKWWDQHLRNEYIVTEPARYIYSHISTNAPVCRHKFFK